MAIIFSICLGLQSPVPSSIKEKLNLGKNICPRYTPNLKHETITFFQNASNLFNAYILHEHHVKLNLNPLRLQRDLTDKILALWSSASTCLIKTLKTFRMALYKTHRTFIAHLKRLRVGFLPDPPEFQMPDMSVCLILIYFNQKINIQQHSFRQRYRRSHFISEIFPGRGLGLLSRDWRRFYRSLLELQPRTTYNMCIPS